MTSNRSTPRPTQLALEGLEQPREHADLLGDRHLGERQHEVRGQLARGIEQRAEEDAQRAHAAHAQLLGERLHPDADELGQRAGLVRLRHLARGVRHVAVFIRVGPRAVAVLEVDAEVLDRLARQLVDDARVHGLGEHPQPQRLIQRRGIGRVLGERAPRHLAQLRRGVGAEQVAASVDHVHRLALRRVAGMERHEREVRGAQRVEQGGLRRGWRRVELHLRSYFQLRCLPSFSHSIVVAMRWSRVAPVLASVTHSR
jgi:hypothetical protein